MPSRSLRTLALLVAVAPAAAGAQIMSNPSQWYIDVSMYSNRALNDMVANSMIAGKAGTAAPNATARTATGATAFRESSTGSIVAALAQRLGGDATRQQAARKAFDGYLALYRQTAAKDGFPANDLAYAFQYFVVNNYHLYHDRMERRAEQITMPQERAIYAQFRQSLGANSAIQGMTDAQKQQAAEQLAIMFGMNYDAYLHRKPQARDMAGQGLEKLLGVPAAQIRVTDAGLDRTR